MEFISGNRITIKQILLDRGNWWKFFLLHLSLIRPAILTNVIKLLACQTKILGYQTWLCKCCGLIKIVCHTCKSRFCSSCGKKATDQWVSTNLAVLPNVPWQHITFTLPCQIWDFFWLNRHLYQFITPIPAAIITELASKKKIIPGIFMAIHSFGRDLKRNVHFHLSTTLCGLSLDKKKWITNRIYFHHKPIKILWQQRVIAVLLQMFEQGNLKLPKSLKHIKNIDAFTAWVNTTLRNKTWVVHLSKPSNNHHQTISYLGRYLKRPPISEARIQHYDGQSVTYQYHDHQSQCKKSFTVSVFEFIKRLITHIPDNNFRMIRYYNWLSNRTRGKDLPHIYHLINQDPSVLINGKVSWRALFIKTFGFDPLICQNCNIEFTLHEIVLPKATRKLLSQHQQLAQAHCC